MNVEGAKSTGGKSDATFTIAGKNYSVRVEDGDDAEAIAKKLEKAINDDPFEDEDAGTFKATAKTGGSIEIEASVAKKN